MAGTDTLPEAEFRTQVGALLKGLMRRLDAVDPDGERMDIKLSDGVLQIDFEPQGSKASATFVLSQQVPVRELWLSAERRAWHFCAPAWTERDTGEALTAVLAPLFERRLGERIELS